MAADKSVRVEVDGLRALQRDLKRVGDDLSDLKDANAAAAALVATEAGRRAPRASGALAGSGRGNRAAGRATVLFGGARIPYAGPVHYGWPAHGIEAQPFVTDAAQASEPEWLAFYQHDLEAAVDRVNGRTY